MHGTCRLLGVQVNSCKASVCMHAAAMRPPPTLRIMGSETMNVLRSRSPLIVVGGAMLWGRYSGVQSCGETRGSAARG